MIKGWSQEYHYIVTIILSYKGWTLVWLLTYIQNKCENNKRLFWFIDRSIEDWKWSCDYWKIKIDYLLFEWDLCINVWQEIYSIFDNYIGQLNCSSIDRREIENGDFVWRQLKLLSIVETCILSITW